MEATTPRSPSQTSPYGGYGHGPYAHPSTYPSPARTEGDTSNNYPSDAPVLYNHYPSMALPNHSVHPAQTMYPLSPHPTEAAWTPSLAASASPGMIDGQRTRGWAPEHYDVMATQWEQSLPYTAYTRHSPALSEPLIMSQRSSVSSTYDHSSSLYSQDESSSPWVKIEPQTEWMSDEDSVLVRQSMTVSPERLGNSRSATAQSEDDNVNTSAERTRSRSLTTAENANYECKLCGRLFQRSYNYKAHKETHDPEREYPHVCQTQGCGRRFVRKTDTVRHVQSVHLKLKNHKCAACDARFARKDTLRRHTEDGCPKRFDVVTRQAQRNQASARKHRALPMRHASLSHHQAAPQHMTPFFHQT